MTLDQCLGFQGLWSGRTQLLLGGRGSQRIEVRDSDGGCSRSNTSYTRWEMLKFEVDCVTQLSWNDFFLRFVGDTFGDESYSGRCRLDLPAKAPRESFNAIDLLKHWFKSTVVPGSLDP